MRATPFALVFVLAACGRSDRTDSPSVTNAPSATSDRGPDQLVLRFSRTGGRVRAFAYPRLDSLIWSSSASAPPLARILAFDENAGAVAAVDGKDVPVRVDLRLGAIRREVKPKLTRVASTDGWAIYGISSDGSITRLTPSATAPWTYKPVSLPRELIPQPDGTLLILSDKGANTTITQLHPPETKITGTAVLPRVQHAVRTPVGDRLYFAVDSGLIGVRSQDLVPVPSVRLENPVRAVVTTPSGDRVYIATGTSNELIVVDRYSENVESRIALPGPATDVRMDPTGRYVLARSATGDSAWVVAVGTDRVMGAVQTEWRTDLPAVAPDGAIVLLRGKDVHLVDGETLRPSGRVVGGGADLWHFISWNGFRPRPATADDPPPIAGAEGFPEDTVAAGNPFAGQLAGSDTSTATPAVDRPPSPSPPPGQGDSASSSAVEFTVQFAALRDEGAARDLAHKIRVGQAPPVIVATTRVLTSVVSGSNIYRVIAGPFRSREEAESASRETGKAYWIYEGKP
ncbi:MAG: SPOR domain-containing protein [Anaerolineae bacterium]|nr:SPOR domain-containing protein [Gemmatimonadaceae bacterium]